jgi:glycosyltransferase involved in cell wall biosynthesis
VWNPVFQLFKWNERFLYRNSDAILTVIPNSFEHIIAHGGHRDAITWIPNGVALEQRPPLKRTELEAPFTMTYFGAHGPYSGLDQLIEAAAILERKGWTSRDIRFVLIGDPPKEELVESARERGVSDMFEFRAAVPKRELWKAIQGTDAFIMIARPIEAHKKGISPNKLWEYFAAARPVLFSIYGGAEMAEESGAGIAVTPGDPSSLAEGVERLYALPPQTRDRMGVSGRRYVEETAEMAKLGERLEQVLGRLGTSCAAEGAGHRLD